MVVYFVFSTLMNPVIYRSFMSLVSFSVLPLDISDPHNQIQSILFCRYNPDLLSLRKHYSMCLAKPIW